MPRTLLIGAIVVVTFLLFLPTIRYALVYDDFEQIVTNPRLTGWSYLPGYFTTHLWAAAPKLLPADFSDLVASSRRSLRSAECDLAFGLDSDAFGGRRSPGCCSSIV
jgi:hypothetical protein